MVDDLIDCVLFYLLTSTLKRCACNSISVFGVRVVFLSFISASVVTSVSRCFVVNCDCLLDSIFVKFSGVSCNIKLFDGPSASGVRL